MIRIAISLVVLAASSLPVAADRAGADACARELPDPARRIYDRSVEAVAAGGNLRETVRATAEAMVKDASLAKADAREQATAAGKCLVKLG